MGSIKIDYEKVNDASLEYKKEAEEITKIKKEMKDIFDEINEAWKGKANNNFNKKFEVQIENLEYFATCLENNSTFLNNITNKHSNAEDTLKNKMEKVSGLCEY